MPGPKAEGEPFAIGVAAPRSPGERTSSTEPRLGMLSTAHTDRSSRLGKQRYIYLKHSLFLLCPQCHVSTGNTASIHADTSGSKCVREAVGILVKRSWLCPPLPAPAPRPWDAQGTSAI